MASTTEVEHTAIIDVVKEVMRSERTSSSYLQMRKKAVLRVTENDEGTIDLVLK